MILGLGTSDLLLGHTQKSKISDSELTYQIGIRYHIRSSTVSGNQLYQVGPITRYWYQLDLGPTARLMQARSVPVGPMNRGERPMY